MLAAGMRTPVAALAFVIELTNSVNPVILAMLVALAGAMLTARQIERRSIYSARLPSTLVPPDLMQRPKPRERARRVRARRRPRSRTKA